MQQKSFCGLDFGTSNSTIGTRHHHHLALIPLENHKPTIRSAIFCDAELKKIIFGQDGINRYLEGTPGRLMMALKSVLGTSLMKEETLIFNEFISFTKILARFISHIKSTAEEEIQHELTQVVMGRPVKFHDTDKQQDKKAQATLEEIAHEVGFKEVRFQYEPIAAALAYEANITKEQLALIIDMGGGTSDFTVIRLRPNNKKIERGEDVLANNGIHIAGTDFDHELSMKSVMPLLGLGSHMQGSSSSIEVPSFYYHDLTTWHTLTSLYSAKNLSQLRSIQSVAEDKHLIKRLMDVIQHRKGHYLLDAVETAKQQLSDVAQTTLNLTFIEDGLTQLISRQAFSDSIADDINAIVQTITQTVVDADVKPEDIEAIFYTGGSTKIPAIRDCINPLFKNAEIILGDVFGSVGMGLTIDAERHYK